MGARPTGDGLPATAFPSGIRGVPAEVIESISPVVMHKRELRPDSEGARSLLGRFRSGDGDRGAQQLPLDPIGHVRPHQVFGTRYMRRLPRGHGNGAHFGRQRPAPETAAADGTDERVILSLPGGGGFGAPTERDPARVARDATDGLVSVERAREVYGIVLTESGQHGERAADTEATGRLREEVTAHPKKDP